MPVGADQSEFRGAGEAPAIVETDGDLLRGHVHEIAGDHLRVGQQLAHAHAERRSTELEGVVERALDAHIEPAVDAAVEELQGKVIDDQNRRHRQDYEHRHHAHRQPGARLACAHATQQAEQIPADQSRQRDEPERVDGEHRRVQLTESRRALSGVAHHHQ